MHLSRIVRAVSLAALIIVTGSAAYGQQPRAGGWLTLRLREDLPQGFAIHESPTISTMWPAMWYPLQAHGEFQIVMDRSGLEPDDPDANFYEHYACGSSRNYSGYCDQSIARLIDQQSQELDPAKRLALVREIQMKLEHAAARPALEWRLDYFTVWPHVKNLVPHHSIYGWGRLQDVWSAK